ncbi:hypothetical protein ACFXHA_22720 [Nocardia sp. NPDC059240]|uniref:hypothetical protein n=1 Tax=Nocardia sp. NPDC059240 TaxID=3346786 RepID=UPI0036BF0BB8
MGGDWLLGIAFGTTATAAAGLEVAAGQVTPIRMPGGVIVIPADRDGAISALRAVLHAAMSARSGPPPAGLALAYPDGLPPHQVETLAQATAALGYPANLVRLIPISAAAAHNSAAYPDDNPASAAARGALLAVIGPAPSYQAPQQPTPQRSPAPAAARPPAQQPWVWVAIAAAVLVIAGGTTTAIVLTSSGDDTTSATGTTTTRFTTSRPTTTPVPTTSAVATVQPDLPSATPPPPPPETTTPSPEPPPTTTVRPAPSTAKPEPSQPDTPETTPPVKDYHEAYVRGSCQGFLKVLHTYPGGLAQMRAQMVRPFYMSPDEWAEAFDRAESGSCY